MVRRRADAGDPLPGTDGSRSPSGAGRRRRWREDAADPTWTPDGRLLFIQGARDIAAWVPGGTPRRIVPTAHSPAPNPSGDRLLFAKDGREGGVWSAQPDGSGARRLLKGERVGGISWSYDGQWIAAVVDGRLRTIRSGGVETRDLGPIGGSTALWSGGTPDLLARRGKSWSVYDAVGERWTDVDLDAMPEPRWIGVRRLLGVRRGSAVELTVGGKAETVSEMRPASDAARYVGLYRGKGFADRYAGAPAPTSGATAWRGKVVAFDPVAGKIDLSVEAEMDARKGETFFALPKARTAKVPVGPLTRRLSVPPNTDAWLVVQGGRVTDVFLPDYPAPATPDLSTAPPETAVAPFPPPARTLRAARAVEYDGVTRERVVVPMTLPHAGASETHRHVPRRAGRRQAAAPRKRSDGTEDDAAAGGVRRRGVVRTHAPGERGQQPHPEERRRIRRVVPARQQRHARNRRREGVGAVRLPRRPPSRGSGAGGTARRVVRGFGER